jgi:hypothetical protein
MAMDIGLVHGIVERLPSLEDGTAGRLLLGMFGGKK